MYVGRFAPTPSGRLHLGSMLALVGSYLRARRCGGRFFLRVEDLDRARCADQNTSLILEEIALLGIRADDEPLIQSRHPERYEEALSALKSAGLTFYCDCTRASLKRAPCRCESRQEQLLSPPRALALRAHLPAVPSGFEDKLLGQVEIGDPYPYLTLRRSDNVISYNLACVFDDIKAQVSEVVRGQDLCYVTPRQIALIRALGGAVPAYVHLPVLLGPDGQKLSKQNHAVPALERGTPAQVLLATLDLLGQETADLKENMQPAAILERAASRFDLGRIPRAPLEVERRWL